MVLSFLLHVLVLSSSSHNHLLLLFPEAFSSLIQIIKPSTWTSLHGQTCLFLIHSNYPLLSKLFFPGYSFIQQQGLELLHSLKRKWPTCGMGVTSCMDSLCVWQAEREQGANYQLGQGAENSVSDWGDSKGRKQEVDQAVHTRLGLENRAANG